MTNEIETRRYEVHGHQLNPKEPVKVGDLCECEFVCEQCTHTFRFNLARVPREEEWLTHLNTITPCVGPPKKPAPPQPRIMKEPIVEALLNSEWADGKCSTCGAYEGEESNNESKHKENCAHDTALTSLGYPDSASRSMARMRIETK